MSDVPVRRIHNEQVKLRANALDRASTACVTAGVIAPATGWMIVVRFPPGLLTRSEEYHRSGGSPLEHAPLPNSAQPWQQRNASNKALPG